MTHLARWSLVLTLWVLAACGSGARDLSLVDSPPRDEPAEDENPEERRRLAELQLVRFYDADGDELAIPATLLDQVFTGATDSWDCVTGTDVCPGETFAPAATACALGTCQRRQSLCLARALQSLASVRAQPTVFKKAFTFSPPAGVHNPSPENESYYTPITGTFSVPAQSPSTRAAILRESLAIARSALLGLTASVTTGGHCAGSAANNAVPWLTTTTTDSYGALTAQVMVEADNLVSELTQDLVDAILTAADAQRSNSLSAEEGAGRSMAGTQLSRAEAAHLLVGGSPGFRGFSTTGLCSSPELSGRARGALAVIRRAAPSPSMLIGGADMATILNGSLSTNTEGSIAVRIALLDGLCKGNPVQCSISSIEDYTGFSTEDFAQARSYLNQETRAFERSVTITFNPTVVGTIQSLPGVSFYAGTRNEPTAPPPEYFAALARYRTSGTVPALQDSDLATILNNTRQQASVITSTLKTVMDATKYPLLKGTLGAFMADDARVGVLRHERTSAGTRFTVFGGKPAHKFRMVRGLLGLLCATTGMVEGAPCSSVDPYTVGYNGLSPTDPKAILSDGSSTTYVGYTSKVTSPIVTLAHSMEPLFLVSARSTEAPGNFDAVTGFIFANTSLNTAYDYPLFPDLERRAGEILRISTDNCARPELECNGAQFDERMPLENELAADNDGVESSWKYYLDLATQASAEAHALGEEHMQNGLELDRMAEAEQFRVAQDEQQNRSRAEAEIETLQDICGTADLSGLGYSNGACSVASNCCPAGANPCPYTCTAGACLPNECDFDAMCCNGAEDDCQYQCVAQRCMKTVVSLLDPPSSNESLTRIKECIGEKSVIPYAVLGSEPVCIWEKQDNPSLVCYNSSAQFPCPAPARWAADDTRTCAGIEKPANTTDPIMIDRKAVGGRYIDVKLRLVDSGFVKQDPCVSVRQIRSGIGNRQELCDSVRNGSPPLFDVDMSEENELVRLMDGGIFYHATQGARARVIQDEKDRWSTLWAIPSSGPAPWPCGDHPFAQPDECTATPNALFCQRLDCTAAMSNASELRKVGRLNERLLNALVVLRTLQSRTYHRITAAQQLTGTAFAEEIAGLSPLHTTDHGDFLDKYYTVPGTYNDIRAFVDDPASSTIPPVFWRFYPSTPANASAVDYPISTTGATVPMIREVPTKAPDSFSQLRNLFDDKALCGDRNLQAWDREHLPRGDTLSSSSIDQGLQPDLPFLSARFNYLPQGIGDAAELLCEASRGVLSSTSYDQACEGLTLGSLQTEADHDKLTRYADCRVKSFERTLGALVLPRIPRRVVDKLHETSTTGSFPTVGGRLGAEMLRLRAALIRFGEMGTTIRDTSQELNDTVAQMGLKVRELGVRGEQEAIDVRNADLRGIQARIKIDQVEFQQQAAWAMAAVDCVGGLLTGLANAYQSNGASMMGSSMDCGKSIAAAAAQATTLGFERRIAEVEAEIAGNQELREKLDSEYIQIENARQLIEFRAEVRSIGGRLAGHVADMRSALEEIRAALAELEGLRFAAMRALGRAVQYQSTQAAMTETIESVLNTKLRISKTRYHRAHKNAVRFAFLAKRAIEQRLGVRLSELRAELPLVEAPSEWESKLCATEGIDYAALSDPEKSEFGKFTDAYIGDYVSRLRNVVESYRLEFDFQEGTDEVVASVRDDIFKVLAPCPTYMGNLLTYSSELDRFAPEGEPGWAVRDCPTIPGGGFSSACLDVRRTTDDPFTASAFLGGANAYAIVWGASSTVSTRLTQELTVEPQRYRLSWYSKMAGSPAAPEVNLELIDVDSNSTVAPVGHGGVSRWTVGTGTWRRHYRMFDVVDTYTGPRDVRVAIGWGAGSAISSVAGIMLEPIGGTSLGEDPNFFQPLPFVATTDTIERTIPTCEDSDGSTFRSKFWAYRCTKLCSDGFTEACGHSDSPERCYWETTIGFDQRDLESGRILSQSGFARGNFNYRIEDVAVNFVGSGVRDCENSSTPDACYGSGFIPYSLKHLGPYFIKNHAGTDFEAKLFTGNIEHARGLGAERYLTNPVSSTDRELIAPYLRTEFQGRPLDGSFVLRVWDEPGVVFDAISDVQLYVKYRYWTRFE
jgi:hypothetical protein